MMIRAKKVLNIFILFSLLTGGLLCLGNEITWAGVGTTGYTFLTLPVGARPVSMGEAFVAISDDSNALFWNPAGLVQVQKPEVNMTHLAWLEEISQENFYAVIPLRQAGTVGCGLNYLHTQLLANRDNRDAENSFYFSDLALTLSYAKNLDKRMLGGVSLKFINEAISVDSLSSLAAAVDLGLIARLNNDLSFGCSIQNIGLGLSGLKGNNEQLPLTLRGGLGYWSSTSALVLALDIEKPINDDFYLHTGAEFNQQGILGGILSERIGYIQRINSAGNQWGMLSGLRLGLGFMISNGIQIDYALEPFGEDLGYTHRISLGMELSTDRVRSISKHH